MLSVDSTLSPPEIEHILKTSSDSITDFNEAETWVSNNYYNASFNAGSLNAYHAVYKAKHFHECTPSYIQTGQNIHGMTPYFVVTH
jgi:hydroxymethylglutaryl-CoA reductase